MYTANPTPISDVKDVVTRRRNVIIQILKDGVANFNQTFSFRLDETLDGMKKVVKQFLTEINAATPNITGDISDYTEPTPEVPVPDASEVAFQAWNNDLKKLVAIKVSVSLGLELATPAQTTTLTTGVQNGMIKSDDRYVSALASYKNIF